MVHTSNEYGVAYGVIIDPAYRILVGPDGNEITKWNVYLSWYIFT